MLRVRREPILDVKHHAFAYQVEAVEAIKNLEYAALFHEQGLGKTKMGLDLSLTWLKEGIVDSVLVVTKKGLVENWREEIITHTHLEPAVLGQDRTANFYAFNRPSRLYLAHYEAVRSERKRLALFLKTRRVGVLLDEAHRIKNPETSVTKALLELAPGFVRRVIMTGTPVANRPYDLWAQIRFLDQGATFGDDFREFRRTYDLSSDLADDPEKAKGFEDALEMLIARIRPFTVRKTKASAGIALPEKEVQNVLVEMAPRQAEVYARYRDAMAAVVLRDGRPVYDDAEEVLKRLLRLVQVASNPHLVDESYAEEPCKLWTLKGLLDEAVDDGSKIIVWTAFTENVDWLARTFARLRPARVHGRMSYPDRSRALTLFKGEESCRVLFATPGAAKEGLTLTVANRAVFFDRSFSLDDYLQAQDRIHRISQERPCLVQNLIARDTVDEWVDALLSAKHLAAQLGQGDIDREQYRASASYEFGALLRAVLGVDRGPKG